MCVSHRYLWRYWCTLSLERMRKRQDAIQDMSHDEDCCNCTEPKGDKYVCCQENHFVPFEDLYEEDKEAMIEEYLTKGN